MMQIDLFDLIEQEEQDLVKPSLFEIGDKVKVRKVQEDDLKKLSTEDLYYIMDFQTKNGRVVERAKSGNGTYTYKVDFDKDIFGYFYHNDLILI